jgi:hypothetical protein
VQGSFVLGFDVVVEVLASPEAFVAVGFSAGKRLVGLGPVAPRVGGQVGVADEAGLAGAADVGAL